MTLSRLHRLATVAVTAGLACGGGEPVPTVTLSKTPTASGDAQTDTVLATLALPYRVLVVRDGAPAQGVTVSWSVPSGAGSVSNSATQTDGNGIASVTRTLGPTVGSQTAQAAVTGASGSPVTFSATATAGNPTLLEKTAGDGVTACAGAQVTHTVTVRDVRGNPKPGVTIDWAATGGGAITPTQNQTAGDGTASATRTVGAGGGSQTTTATASAIPQPATFTLTGVSGSGGTIAVDVNDNFFAPQSAAVGVCGSVIWTWRGINTHNVTYRSGPTPLPANSQTKTSGTHTNEFLQAGTYGYVCTIHESLGMTGTVTVTP